MVFSTHPGTALVTIHTRPKLLATWSKGTKWPKSWLKLGKGKDIQRCVVFCTNTMDHSGHNSGSVGAWINLMHERWTSLIISRTCGSSGRGCLNQLGMLSRQSSEQWESDMFQVSCQKRETFWTLVTTLCTFLQIVVISGMYFSSCAYVSTESIWESSSSIGRNRSSSSHSSASAMCSWSSGAKFWGPAAFVPNPAHSMSKSSKNLNINTYVKYHVIQIDCMFLRIADLNQRQNLWNPLGKALGSPILT